VNFVFDLTWFQPIYSCLLKDIMRFGAVTLRVQRAGMNMLLRKMKHSLQTSNREVLRLGKKKVLSEGQLNEMVYPSQGEVLGVVVKLLGFDRIMVKCQDGKERLCRIRGKMKRRVWIREGDIVVISPWDFQSDKRGDVVWRYTHAQADILRKKGYLTI
jgi:translation initiation factor 1A